MIEMYNGSATKDKKLLHEAQQMLSDARRKIEYIRMQIVRLRNQQVGSTASDTSEGENCRCIRLVLER
jgi:hypothetical protein